MTLDDALEAHFLPLNPAIQHPDTEKQYRIALANFHEALGRKASVDDLTDDNVARMMRALLQRDLAPRTINERRGRIHSLWTFLTKRGLAKDFPTTARIPEPKRTPSAWTKEQLHRLFAALSTERGGIGHIPAGDWWRALLLVAWDTGERIGALISIGWDDLDLEAGYLTIPAERRKGKSRDMLYRLAPDTVCALRKLRRKSAEVFPWPYHPLYLWQRYERILKAAGLPHGRRDKFHRIRRSVASHFEAAGGNATSLLGHTDRATTLGYLDPRIVNAECAVDRLFRPEE